MLENNPDIFALYETNLHEDIQDSDFQLPGYLPIHCNDAGLMHSLGVYVKSNLLIAREAILEDENKSYVFSFGPSSNIDKTLLISWYVVSSLPITLSDFIIPIPLMLRVCFVNSLLWHKTSPKL